MGRKNHSRVALDFARYRRAGATRYSIHRIMRIGQLTGWIARRGADGAEISEHVPPLFIPNANDCLWRKAVIGQRGDVRKMPIRKGPPECGRAGHHLAQCEAVSRYLIGGQWKLVADTLRWRAHVQLPPAASGGHQPRQTHRMVKGYFPRAWWTAFKLAQARDKFRVRIVDRP